MTDAQFDPCIRAGSPDVDAEVCRLEALGARRIARIKSWCVMEAPTGRRFCVVPSAGGDFDDVANVWP